MSALPFRYKSKGHSEYGIYVELYLPKHAEFQGKLFETLTNGFVHDKVRKHFLDSQTRRKKINRLLKLHKYKVWKNYTADYVDSLESLYWGYSLYEVDGVFKPDKGEKVIEERTQIIRITFLPEKLNDKFKELKVKFASPEHEKLLHSVARFLRMPKNEETLEEFKREKLDKFGGKEKAVLQLIYDWYIAVGFFLFGYLVFEICSEISKFGATKKVDYEQVIWLTSFWNFTANRIELIEIKTREETSK